MKLNKLERDLISTKNEKLESIKPILKSEFIGIDDSIDQIIEAIRPYYIFPKSLKRPLVVNLFGMTGTGKTHVIERIVDLLQVRHKFFRFDVGDYAKNTSDWALKNDLSDNVKKTKDKDLILVFDEFQFGRNIDEKGKEIDRSSLRPMWEMIDSGIIQVSNNTNSLDVYKNYECLKKCLQNGVEVLDGIVVGNVDLYHSMVYNTIKPYVSPCNFKDVKPYKIVNGVMKEASDMEYVTNNINVTYDPNFLENPYFVTEFMYRSFYQSNPKVFEYINDYDKWKHVFLHKNPKELINFIMENFIKNSPLMKKKDFTQSLIFVVGNIDEAYTMSHSSDPDADADIFCEWSKKINVPRMKNALSFRFRMEQIGRLGNNMIIYPALNSESYKKIIQKHLNLRIQHFKEEFGITLEFTDSLKDIIYKESVYPTQGVRPVLSTFNSLIDSYISKLVADLILKAPKTKNIIWDFIMRDNKEEGDYVFKTDKLELKYLVKLQLENLRKSDNSEKQLYTAVHEAGHAILAMTSLKLIPKTVVSKTASMAEGFCRLELPSTKTKEFMFNELVYILGGREAELAIFGENNLSNGAGSDLNAATTMAAAMAKSLGLTGNPYCVQGGNYINQSISTEKWICEAEKKMVDILLDAEKEAKRLVSLHLDKIIELAEFLGCNSKIEKAELEKMAKKWYLEIRNKDEYYQFKQLLNLKKQQLSKKNTDIIKRSSKKRITLNNKRKITVNK